MVREEGGDGRPREEGGDGRPRERGTGGEGLFDSFLLLWLLLKRLQKLKKRLRVNEMPQLVSLKMQSPLLGLQMSSVKGSPSLHALVSLCWQPFWPSQKSSVHGFRSSQVLRVVLHLPTEPSLQVWSESQ